MPAPQKRNRTRSIRTQFWARQDILTEFDVTREDKGFSRDGGLELAMELFIGKFKRPLERKK